MSGSSYLQIPPTGGFSPYWQDAALDFASLGVGEADGEVKVTLDTRSLYMWNGATTSWDLIVSKTAIVGPASSTDNALMRWDGTNGQLAQNSVGILSDAGALSGLSNVTSNAVNVTGFGGGKALVSSGTGVAEAAATTTTEIGYVNGVTSPIQPQINGKQPVGNYITAITGDLSASGPGSVPGTVNAVGGSTAALVHSAELLANAATSANTASAIVKRDASGGFVMGTLSAVSAKVGATGAPIASAALEVSSTTQCFYPPRMTTAQRTAITAANGGMVYDTDLNLFHGWVNGAWTPLHGWGY